MKIINKKTHFYAIAYFFLALSPCPAQAIGLSWYQKAKRTLHLIHHAVTHKAEELDDVLANIDTQFKDFELWMIAQEKKALDAIKEKYTISDALWQKCLDDIAHIKTEHSTHLQQVNPDVVHDNAVPTAIKDMLLALMKKNSINPESINLVMADEAKIKAKPNTIAETIIEMEVTQENNELIFKLTPNPTKITFFPRAITASYEKKMVTIAHELQHVISHHGITEYILLTYLIHHCGIDEATFKKTAEYHRLCQIHEAQAEILAAITDENVAHHLKSYRKNNHYIGFLYEEHFYCLSTIDTLWKLRKKLMTVYCS